MSINDIDPEVRSRLLQSLTNLPPGSCFTRCQLSSFSQIVLRCTIPLPERIVRFMVLTSSVRDERGEAFSAGEPVLFGTAGWVLAEMAGISNGPIHRKIVRIRQVQGDGLEIEVEGGEVISPT